MSKRAKEITKYVLSAALAVALLYFSFRGIKWTDFMDGLRSCNPWFILLSMVASVAAFWLRALRWRLLILPIDRSISRTTAFNAINIGYLVNLALPRIGEFVRCGVITDNSENEEGQPHKKASYDKVLGTAVTDRLWDVLSMMILLVVILSLMWSRYGSFFQDEILSNISGKKGLMWILAGGCMLLGLCIYTIRALRFRFKICGRIHGLFSGIWQGISSCMKMEQSWKFFVYTALIWAMYWLMSASILWSLQGIDPSALDSSFSGALQNIGSLDLGDALFLMMAGALSSLVPVPGGFGAFHYVVALALSSVYDIPFELGIIFGTLSHESQVITELIFGGISYGWEALRKKK